MGSYDVFARFYDAVMGDRAPLVERLCIMIRENCPHARSVLELGCGTGALIEQLAEEYAVTGVDLSDRMLDEARKRGLGARVHRQDMARFSLPGKFDVVLCVFDTGNHLLDFEQWRSLFRCVGEHLLDGGVFVFDVNMPKKLRRLVGEPAFVHTFDSNVMVMDVTQASRNVANWNVKVFEHVEAETYRLHEEDIREVAFPRARIQRSLDGLFETIEVLDLESAQPRRGERLYFVCRAGPR